MIICKYKHGGVYRVSIIYIIKSLSHENRLRILNLLKKQELCVCELENIMEINQSNVSRHLNKLKQAGIIKSNQKAQWVYYSLNKKILKKYLFINVLIEKELGYLKICEEDNERLKKYQESGFSCKELRQGIELE